MTKDNSSCKYQGKCLCGDKDVDLYESKVSGNVHSSNVQCSRQGGAGPRAPASLVCGGGRGELRLGGR